MRFEVGAAYGMGISLPLLETFRRGFSHWLENATTMADDYVAGALLLIAAWSSSAKRSYAPVLLLLGWAYISGVMFGSFWGQLESTLRGVVWEESNTTVLVFKGAIWTISVTSLILALLGCLKQADDAAFYQGGPVKPPSG